MASYSPLHEDAVARRFVHYPPKDDATIRAHEKVRAAAATASSVFVHHCPEGRELSLAITKLEEAMMWANAAIARPS